MKTFWAGMTLAALSLASAGDSGCNCAKFFGPRFEKPAIGTRSTTTGSLNAKSSVDSAKILGCDLKYWNMPSGSSIKLVWQFYGSEDSDEPDNKTKSDSQSVNGSGTITAYLQSREGDFEPGIYECKFTADADGKTVYESPGIARITVGKVKKGGGKKSKSGDDDDDSPKKKKKSKKEDDD